MQVKGWGWLGWTWRMRKALCRRNACNKLATMPSKPHRVPSTVRATGRHARKNVNRDTKRCAGSPRLLAIYSLSDRSWSVTFAIKRCVVFYSYRFGGAYLASVMAYNRSLHRHCSFSAPRFTIFYTIVTNKLPIHILQFPAVFPMHPSTQKVSRRADFSIGFVASKKP